MPNPALTSIAEEARNNAGAAAAALGRLPDGVSVARFIADYAAVGRFDHYRHIPDAARAALAQVTTAQGPEAARSFLRAALGQGVAELIVSGRLEALPSRIVHHHSKQLQRIASAIANDADWFDPDSDLLLKDLGLVTLRLYAAAAQLLDTRCGIPRSLIFREGLAAVPKNLLKFVQLGGFKPFIQIHTHLSFLDDFNEEGWNECYRCCADLYQVRPDLLGMYGSSWFYDPVLADISPRLDYLREIPVKGGAQLIFVEEGGEALDNALSTSPSRRKLHDEGKYMPRSYMMAWGRQQQMAWAARNPGGAA